MKFSGMRTSAGNGPKYIRTLPLTIILSCPMAAASTPTSPRKKVFRLGVVGATEHFLNKNVSPTGHGEQPEDHGENESDRQQIRRLVSFSHRNSD